MKSLGIKVTKADTQNVLEILLKNGYVNKNLVILKEENFVTIPLTREVPKSILPFKVEILYADFEEREVQKPQSLKEALKGQISKEQEEALVRAFDIIGDIAIIEVPDLLLNKEKELAKAIMKVHPNIKTVVKKSGAHSGEFRTRQVTHLAGEEKTITRYKESSADLMVDVDKVFFTPRLSFERSRLSQKVKKGETVAVFFAGVGPFSIVIAKNASPKKVYSIELNPRGVELMKENIKINKVEDKVIPILADVKDYAKEIKEECDRVVMPLPKTGYDFLDEALLVLKPTGGIIHFYMFGPNDEPYSDALNIIDKVMKRNKKDYEIVSKRVVRPFSAKLKQVVIDIKVN